MRNDLRDAQAITPSGAGHASPAGVPLFCAARPPLSPVPNPERSAGLARFILLSLGLHLLVFALSPASMMPAEAPQALPPRPLPLAVQFRTGAPPALSAAPVAAPVSPSPKSPARPSASRRPERPPPQAIVRLRDSTAQTPSLPATALASATADNDAAPGGAAATEGRTPGARGGATESLEAPRFDAAYLHNPKPPYPPLARRRGQEGLVVLQVAVNAAGLAEQVSIQRSSGFEILDDAARSTVAHWRFTPARRGDQAVAATVFVPIRFKLED